MFYINNIVHSSKQLGNILWQISVCSWPMLHSFAAGNCHHSMFHNPTAAVNLFHVGKQYLTLCKAETAVTRNLIGRKIISNVKHADARNSLPILDVIRSSHKRHAPQCVRILQINATSNNTGCLLYAYIRTRSAHLTFRGNIDTRRQWSVGNIG